MDTGNAGCRSEREPPPGISGQVILVMSGQSRMMYQYLAPEPEGAIFCKRSMPQATYSSPHDTIPVSHTNPSIANWQEPSIQGNEEFSKEIGSQ